MLKKTLKVGMQYREATVERASVNEQARTVELSFSSEAAVERWFGNEILDHSPSSVRLGRLNQGGALLVDHNTREQVGVVERALISGDRKGRASVRFGKSARAEQEWQDVLDGIRTNVSVGYQVHRMVLEETTDGVDTYRCTDWEPMEISMVAVPADMMVGVGRGQDKDARDIPIERRQTTMPDKDEKTGPATVTVEDAQARADAAVKAERARVAEIQAIADRVKAPELAAKAIKENLSLEDFKDLVLREKFKAVPIIQPSVEIGLTDQEAGRFSICRAILAQGERNWKNAGFEKECSDAVATRMRKDPNGFFIPYDVLSSQKRAQMQRDLTAASFTGGGALVATVFGSFIELLRNRMMVRRLGATILGGLQGDVALPRQSGAATAYWVSENNAITESQQTLGQVALSPHTVGAFTDLSRRLLIQSSIDVEGMVQSDLATVLAIELDRVAINGLGTGGQPNGILQWTGIGDVAGGTNGATPTYGNMVDLETSLGNANADMGNMAYLTNSKVRGIFKQTPKIGTTFPIYIWENGQESGVGILNGYNAYVSNNVPNNLSKGSAPIGCSAIIFGNWSDLVIGEWGAVDVLVDPYTGGAAGTLRVRVMQDVDVAIRHALSFAAMQDALVV